MALLQLEAMWQSDTIKGMRLLTWYHWFLFGIIVRPIQVVKYKIIHANAHRHGLANQYIASNFTHYAGFPVPESRPALHCIFSTGYTTVHFLNTANASSTTINPMCSA